LPLLLCFVKAIIIRYNSRIGYGNDTGRIRAGYGIEAGVNKKGKEGEKG